MSLKIGFIGAGQMATALARGFVASQETNDGPTISFFDPSSEACDRFSNSISAATLLADAQQVVTSADIVFLAVKPQILPSVLDSIAAVVTLDVLLVSIAAGVRLDVICGRTGSDRVIRVMPNCTTTLQMVVQHMQTMQHIVQVQKQRIMLMLIV